MRVRTALPILVLLPLACATGGDRAALGAESSSPAIARAPAAAAPAIERPIPYPVDLPPGYVRALERGTRSANGAPGPRYWEQEAEYRIAVRIDTDARRLDGTTTIAYHNESPDTLETLVVQLLQNLHAPGSARSFEEEVTDGVEFSFNADNIFDRYYIDPLSNAVLPAPGRTLRAALTAKF